MKKSFVKLSDVKKNSLMRLEEMKNAKAGASNTAWKVVEMYGIQPIEIYGVPPIEMYGVPPIEMYGVPIIEMYGVPIVEMYGVVSINNQID